MSNKSEETEDQAAMENGIAVELSTGVAIGILMDDLAIRTTIGAAIGSASELDGVNQTKRNSSSHVEHQPVVFSESALV